MTVSETPLNRSPAWREYVARLQAGASSEALPPLPVPAFGLPRYTVESSPHWAGASVSAPGQTGGRLSGTAVAAGEVPAEWLERIRRASLRHGVSEALLAAVLKAESNFNAYAVSPKGAGGAMQIMPGTARALGLQNIFDPDANLDAGAFYLSSLLREFSRPDLALAAYNAGPDAVRHFGGLPPYAETQAYVRKVLSLCRRYSQDLSLPPAAD